MTPHVIIISLGWDFQWNWKVPFVKHSCYIPSFSRYHCECRIYTGKVAVEPCVYWEMWGDVGKFLQRSYDIASRCKSKCYEQYMSKFIFKIFPFVCIWLLSLEIAGKEKEHPHLCNGFSKCHGSPDTEEIFKNEYYPPPPPPVMGIVGRVVVPFNHQVGFIMVRKFVLPGFVVTMFYRASTHILCRC